MNDQEQIEFLYNHFKDSKGVSTDTRKIDKGMIYFALKGENFDGNKFAKDALERGASLAVIDNSEYETKNTFLVNNSLISLQSLARQVRSMWDFPVLAICGSNGKTTTKELITAVLSQKYSVFSTPGNYNNHIGLPLTLLMVPDNCNFLVLEMGANHLGEHEFLCSIAEPNYGLVTNHGMDHLEGYGSFENVIKSNSELFEYLKLNGGKAFVNADDGELLNSADGTNLYQYSFEKNTDFKAKKTDHNLFAGIEIDGITIKSNLVGNFNNANILAASAIGRYFDLKIDQIKTAIEAYEPKQNRSQLIELDRFNIMLDAYNANPSSMKLAIKTIEESTYSQKMVILGGMLELGQYEKEEHKNVVNLLESSGIDKVWLVGKEFEKFQNKDSITWFENTDTCKIAFESLKLEDGIVLIKGSRKYQLEKLIP